MTSTPLKCRLGIHDWEFEPGCPFCRMYEHFVCRRCGSAHFFPLPIPAALLQDEESWGDWT